MCVFGGGVIDARCGTERMGDRRTIETNWKEKGGSDRRVAKGEWLTGRQRDWLTGGVEIERRGPNLLSLLDKRGAGTKARPSAVWSADKAWRFWNGEGPLRCQISPRQWLTPHKRAAGPEWFMSRRATKPFSSPENTPNNTEGTSWTRLSEALGPLASWPLRVLP